MPKPLPEIQIMLSRARPMRYGNGLAIMPPPKLEQIAAKGVRDMANRHVVFTREIFDILPTPGLDAVRSAEGKELTTDGAMQFWAMVTKGLEFEPPTCGHAACGREVVLKEFSPGEMASIDMEFMANVGPEAARAIDAAGESFVMDAVGDRDGIQDTPIYDAILTATVIEALRLSLYRVTQALGRTSVQTQRRVRRTAYSLTGREDWILDIYRRGYDLVSAKITRFFLPTLKEIINTELRAGMDWRKIATLINRKVGVGASFHWRRLIRNEMAAAISRIAIEQYRAYDVALVYLSLSMRKREPNEICKRLQDRDFGWGPGWYPIELFPVIPIHVGCLCLGIPKYGRKPTAKELAAARVLIEKAIGELQIKSWF